MSVAVMLLACGNSTLTSGGVDAGGCSSDNSQATAAGKYAQYWAPTSTTNVLILLSNCRWCADAIADGGSKALTSEGSWSSVKQADAGSGIKVTKTNSAFFNIVSADGQSAVSYQVSDGTYVGFEYAKGSALMFTCDGL